MFNWIEKLLDNLRLKRREKLIIKTCGAICYCPHCNDPLNDQADWFDFNNDGSGFFLCDNCRKSSQWHFGVTPAPICETKPKRLNSRGNHY